MLVVFWFTAACQKFDPVKVAVIGSVRAICNDICLLVCGLLPNKPLGFPSSFLYNRSSFPSKTAKIKLFLEVFRKSSLSGRSLQPVC